MVYGGGNIGLLGTIADTVISNQGYVTGVIPNFLVVSSCWDDVWEKI